jgi:hypothetical protein
LKAIALVRAGRIGKVKKVTCGINGWKHSPVIPETAPPVGLDWDRWLGPAPAVAYRALPEIRQGYGGGVPLYSNCHYSFRNWHEYSGGKMTDWGAHHVDIACNGRWDLRRTGPAVGSSRSSSPSRSIYKDGMTVADRYNAATEVHDRGDARRRGDAHRHHSATTTGFCSRGRKAASTSVAAR